MKQILKADFIDFGDGFVKDACIVMDAQGLVIDFGSVADKEELHNDAYPSDFKGHIIVPGCVNAHSHSFQVLMRGYADQPINFADWVSSHLYPTVLKLDDECIELAAIVAFAQMLKAGTTSLGEFHYIHNDAQGPGGHRIDEIVLSAARRLGLRTTMARCFYDQAKRPGQERFRETPEQAIEATRALRDAFKDDPLATVIPAPHSLHGASREMIEAAYQLAEEFDCPYHIHLSEQKSDLEYSRSLYNGLTPLEALDSIGVLSSRTVIVHGLWLTEKERALLSDRGGSLVYNPTTNMALGDGVANIPDLMSKGVPIALGTDANYTMSIFSEMRAMEYLQRVQKLEMGVLPRIDGRGSASLLESGRIHGSRVLGTKTGRLDKGMPADLVVIDRDEPSLLPASVTGGEAVRNALISSMIPETAVKHVFVQGQKSISHGQLVSFSNGELAEMMEKVTRKMAEK
ncbi:MAG: amidohydrolase family protein [Planctomycetota bacterium]|nr:amidohydrolase family protein [Planctomycetota bacterium]